MIDTKAIRQKTFFGFDWQFLLEEGETLTPQSACGAQGWRGVQLPHDWSIDYPIDENNPSCGSGGYFKAGIGWYRKSFDLPEKGDKRMTLLFDGVYMNCTVWLNGEQVGRHVYGYTSFEADITSAAKAGANDLLVRVDNSMQPGSRWYSGSGITRDVWLRVTGATYVPLWGTYITTPVAQKEEASVEIITTVGGAPRGALAIETTLIAPCGTEAARVTSAAALGENHQILAIEQPALWSHEQPALYTAVTRVLSGGVLLDEIQTRFGIRDILFDADKGFFINGDHLKLRGVCVHHDGGCVGAAVPPEIWRERFKTLRSMGCNAIRCSHNPPDPAFLDLCDEMGFYVMDEAFDEWRELKGKEFGSNTHASRGYSEWFDDWHYEDLTSMLLRDRNHPSIVIWSVGNEVPEQKTEEGIELALELVGIVHRMDPTRPVTQANDQIRAEPMPALEGFLDVLDIVGYNYVDRWRERTELYYGDDKLKHPHWTMIGTEHSSVGGKRMAYDIEGSGVWGRSAYHAKMLKAEKLLKFTEAHDYVAGDFMWTGIDHLGECHWPDKGSSSGVIDTCGHPKDGYHFYKSQWTDEPMLHLLPHANLDFDAGKIIPVIAYTNCQTVELFVGGVSYGRKCYEYPAQGMSLRWPHFDKPIAPITTNDLHLSWDVPFGKGEIEAVGCIDGKEVLRKKITPAGKPARLCVRSDTDNLCADGRAVAQVYVRVLDADGNVVPAQDIDLTFEVQGAGRLLATDNGCPHDHTLYGSAQRATYGGLAYAVVRAAREAGQCAITVRADGLEDATVTFTVG